MHSDAEFRRLIVVSNRLPVGLAKSNGQWSIKPGAGGLVTALAPVLRDRGGTWIGWSGAHTEDNLDGLFSNYSRDAGYSLVPVSLSREQVDNYYFGFSNEVIWPLFHDFQSRCRFIPDYWRSYLEVNGIFADAVQRCLRPRDYIWVHDYHLFHVAHLLKQRGVEQKCGFFLHIPFPPPDIFLKLPWRSEIIQALMDFELVGFQTMRDRKNFTRCLQLLLPGATISGRGGVITAEAKGHRVRLGAIPISIDAAAFADTARSPRVTDLRYSLKRAFKDRKIILGVDRLDYSKGIPQRLESFRCALEHYPELRERVTFVQILVPSRETVGEYERLRSEIEQLVGQINGQYSVPGWIPIHYAYTSFPREELVAYYRAADIALVTPLKDGMNLVAKEYCMSKTRGGGVLLLSEFAGAAAQLQRYGAVLVNPYDVEGVAAAIHQAFVMPEAEQRSRMRRMRRFIREHDIYWWVDSFLMAAFSRHLRDFPSTESMHYESDANRLAGGSSPM